MDARPAVEWRISRFVPCELTGCGLLLLSVVMWDLIVLSKWRLKRARRFGMPNDSISKSVILDHALPSDQPISLS